MDKKQYIEQLFNLMGQLHKFLESQGQESQKERTATIMQFSALKFLQRHKNSTVGDTAENLRLSKSSATQLIERLVKAGLAKRIHDQKDRRIVHVTITLTGEQCIVDMKKKFMDKIGKILSKIPDKDMRELIRIHSNLIKTLEKEQK